MSWTPSTRLDTNRMVRSDDIRLLPVSLVMSIDLEGCQLAILGSKRHHAHNYAKAVRGLDSFEYLQISKIESYTTFVLCESFSGTVVRFRHLIFADICDYYIRMLSLSRGGDGKTEHQSVHDRRTAPLRTGCINVAYV